MPEVVVYLTQYCPYSIRARMLLDRKGIAYQEIDVDAGPGLRAEMEKRSGRHTVPQIFIGDHHVGGYDDMAELDREGRLDPLLGLSART